MIIGYPMTFQVTDHYELSVFPLNMSDKAFLELKRLLKEEVFGQHIATKLIARQIEAHLTNPSPSKPLVMSFHGWTGNGKNHVAYLIAKSLYKSEVKSPFYHHFMSTAHFPHSVR